MVLPAGQESFQLQPSDNQQAATTNPTRKDIISEIWKLGNDLRQLDLNKRMAEIGVQYDPAPDTQKKYDEAVQTLNRTMEKVNALAQSLNQLPVEENLTFPHTVKQVSELSKIELLSEAKAFMLNRKHKDNSLTEGRNPTSIIDFFEKRLQNEQGITIGETHNDDILLFLSAEMINLKKIGVTTIFLEGIMHEFQKDVDEENWPKLTDETQKFPMHDKTKNLIEMAHKEGIRVVGLDTMNLDEVSEGTDRIICFNYVASKIINDEEGKGKFLALVGATHGTSLYNGAISGISELTGTGSVEIYRNQEEMKRVTTMLQSRFGDTRKKPSAVMTLSFKV